MNNQSVCFYSSIFGLLNSGSVTNSPISSRHGFLLAHRCCGAFNLSSIGGSLARVSAVTTDIAPSRIRLLSAHLTTLNITLSCKLTVLNAFVVRSVIFVSNLRSTWLIMSTIQDRIILRVLLRIGNIVVIPIEIWNDVHRSYLS